LIRSTVFRTGRRQKEKRKNKREERGGSVRASFSADLPTIIAPATEHFSLGQLISEVRGGEVGSQKKKKRRKRGEKEGKGGANAQFRAPHYPFTTPTFAATGIVAVLT